MDWVNNPGYFQDKGYIVWLGPDGKWHSNLEPVFNQRDVDQLLNHEQAVSVWVLPNATRSQALSAAKKDWKAHQLGD